MFHGCIDGPQEIEKNSARNECTRYVSEQQKQEKKKRDVNKIEPKKGKKLPSQFHELSHNSSSQGTKRTTSDRQGSTCQPSKAYIGHSFVDHRKHIPGPRGSEETYFLILFR